MSGGQAALEFPSDLRERPRPVRLTLLAACAGPHREVTAPGELLIGIVHKIGTEPRTGSRAKCWPTYVGPGKEAILFCLAEAAVEHPDETVRSALYPVVSEATLRDLSKRPRPVRLSSSPGPQGAAFVVLQLLPPDAATVARALEFRSNNTDTDSRRGIGTVRPLCRPTGTVRYYAGDETVPLAGVVRPTGRRRDRRAGPVERVPYELCVLRALRDGLRRRELWVVGPTAGGP